VDRVRPHAVLRRVPAARPAAAAAVRCGSCGRWPPAATPGRS
jgi:hypothetical protein